MSFCIWFCSWSILHDKAFPENSFMLKYCLGKFKTQEMSDKAVDSFLLTLKFIPDWFFTSRIIKKLYNSLWTDDSTLLFDKDFGNVTFWSGEVGVLIVILNNINLDEAN